jgi:hypothetical protein
VPIYITDAGSIKSFVQFLKEQSAFHIQENIKGVWQQAKSSLLSASSSKAEYILYTEPDKLDFLSNHLPSLLNSIEVNNITGVYLFSRSTKSFETFPKFQQMTETTINNCCKEIIQLDADYTYGPFILNKNIVSHLLQLPGDIGWGWRPFAFNMAKRMGYTLEFIEGDFFCPEDQREDLFHERIYRMMQLQQNIEGLVLSTKATINI